MVAPLGRAIHAGEPGNKAGGAAGVKASVVEVRGTKPLAIGTLAERAPINTNRDYLFLRVPEVVRGLQYTSHQHKNSSTVSVRVKRPGPIYLCLWGGATPESLNVDGAWEVAGRMQGLDLSHKNRWMIYRTDLGAGETFAIRSPDRWGAVVAAGRIEGVAGVKPGPGATSGASKGASGEFAEIEKRLRSRRPGDGKYRRRQEVLASQVAHKDALLLDGDRDPLDVVLRRTGALLDDLSGMKGAPGFDKEASELAELLRARSSEPLRSRIAEQSETGGSSSDAVVTLFDKATKLRRRIAFKNPLLDFNEILFVGHHKSRYNHMCDQYYGFNSVPGGGLYVLSDPFGPNPSVRDVLAGSVVKRGRLKGRKLTGGSFISADLSWDAKSILFAYAECGKGKPWSPERSFHVFKVNVDGTNLVQLTDGLWNDFDPCFLPSGRIAFVSERRGGFLRCGGRPCPTYTVHGMMPDGSDIIPLSHHETHEWHPSVDNAGMIVYSRWDYVDRDSDIAHHMWLCYPDGRDPRSFHGNYPTRREFRPWMELAIRAIPGSHKYVAVAAPHHGQNYGSLVLIDHRLEDDDGMSQVRRITPEVPMPESESAPGVPHRKGRHSPRAEVYGTPWPLSEDYYLSVYDPRQKHYGIYLVDGFGNKELIYRDPRVPCLDPIPLRPRRRPPVIPVKTTQAAADRGNGPERTATIAVMDVYDADFEWPKGSKIKELRIVQIFPKATPRVDVPRIGLADQALARGVVGTVPVEPDGSAFFEAPVGVPIYFQALDERGIAIQTMRSDTFVHRGEQLVCQGCHEPKRRALDAAREKVPAALRRPPSKIKPEADGSYPLIYPRLVQGVLDRNCVPCHTKNRAASGSSKEATRRGRAASGSASKGARRGKKPPDLSGGPSGRHGWSKSFQVLSRYGWGRHGGNGALYAKNAGCSRSIAGKIGARASKLFTMLEKGHNKLKLAPEDLRRITLWLDCNTCFYGAYRDTDKQLLGEVVMPKLE